MPDVQDLREEGRAVHDGGFYEFRGCCGVLDEYANSAVYPSWNGHVVFA